MKKNVLIVDDFENTLFVTGFTIEREGYNVLKADSAKKALQIIKTTNPIDLIITDYNMPEMNGIQFIKEIKEYYKNKRVPIFVLSTEPKDEIKRAAMEAGATLWIRKPFKTEQLIEYIKRTIL